MCLFLFPPGPETAYLSNPLMLKLQASFAKWCEVSRAPGRFVIPSLHAGNPSVNLVVALTFFFALLSLSTTFALLTLLPPFLLLFLPLRCIRHLFLAAGN